MKTPLWIFCMLMCALSSCAQRPISYYERPVYEKPVAVRAKPLPPPAPAPLPKATPAPKVAVSLPKKSAKVVLDAGHGGKDPGAHSKKEHYEEKQLTLVTTKLVQKYLEEMGYHVLLTRENDSFLELSARAEKANSAKADLFVSIHYNFCEAKEVEGIEIFYYQDAKNPGRVTASKKLGREVLSRIVKHTGAESRGVKPGNLAVVRETTMPAILIEGGFLSHAKERVKIQDSDYRCYLAWAIARGIDAYFLAK